MSPNLLPQLQLLRPPRPAHPPCGRRAHTPRPRLLFGRFVAPLPRANGLRKLSFRGAIVPGSSCKQLPGLRQPSPQRSHPPSRYGHNFPAVRHSRLTAALGEHELAAEAQSPFALLPDSLMLHIACGCDEVQPESPPAPRVHAPRLNSQLFTRPLFCGWAPCAVAGASLFATPQCGARCALQRGRGTTPPRRRLQISGAAGRRCCSHARGS